MPADTAAPTTAQPRRASDAAAAAAAAAAASELAPSSRFPDEIRVQYPRIAARPPTAGPDTPVAPFPVYLQGAVSAGFGRGSKDLGIPTANLPEDVAQAMAADLQTGIYYGWASVSVPPPASGADAAAADAAKTTEVWPMVMSYGWNPYYKNQKRSAEVHIIHQFDDDFYGEILRVAVCGYIRDERDYEGLDELIQDIRMDMYVAQQSLARPVYTALKHHTALQATPAGTAAATALQAALSS